MFGRLVFILLASLIAGSTPANEPVLLQLLQAESDSTPADGMLQLSEDEMANRFPVGFGQLTVHGCNLSYNFGHYIRETYGGRLIHASYVASEILVRSLDKDASLSTALCFLQGLYPCMQCHPACLRTGIPVHTEAMDRDFLLNCRANCPVYKSLYNLQTGDIVKRLRREHMSVLQKLKKFQSDRKEEITFKRVQDIYAVIRSRVNLGLRLQQSLSSGFPGGKPAFIEAIKHLDNHTTYLEYSTWQKARLKAGYLIGTILNNMEMKFKDGPEASRNFYHYVTERRCLVGLLAALNISARIPEQDFAIGFELLQRRSENEVKIFIHDVPTGSHAFVFLSSCGPHVCSLSLFKRILSSVSLYPLKKRHKACS